MKQDPSSQDQEILKILKEMESLQVNYPEELLASRRAAFLNQVAQSTPELEVEQQLVSQDLNVTAHLKKLGSYPQTYPTHLLASRRAAFVRRIAWLNFVSQCAAVWQAVQKRIYLPAFKTRVPALRTFPTYLLAAGLALAVFMGFLFYENQDSVSQLSRPQSGAVQSGRILTSNTRAVKIICKDGAQPPLCLAGEYKGENGLTNQRNGSARPAVAKDSMPSSQELHKAANINDGMYGPGASWISNSRNSWIKIDLGKTTEINTVTFGRDRLGKLTGHNPGQFVVSLAINDDVYANGNNSNDNKEYQPVFNSKKTGFNGTISGAETVTAQFKPHMARYIKITFENKGAVIDEVEAFMAQPPVASKAPDNKSDDKPPANGSNSQATNMPYPSINTATSQPPNTATATSVPTNTPVPSETATPIPTATVVPTNTPVPTSTAVPTTTPTSAPSDTPVPPPTDTPVPADTSTPASTEVTPQPDTLLRTDIYDVLTLTADTP